LAIADAVLRLWARLEETRLAKRIRKNIAARRAKRQAEAKEPPKG